MIGKKIQFIVLLLLIGVAAFSSWYLYQQSQKLKQVNRQESGYRQELASDEQNGTSDTDRAANADGSQIRPVQEEESGAEEDLPTESNATDKEAGSLASKIQDVFLTSFVAKDAAAYFIEHYHPAGSRNNSGSQGTLDVSFKTLNARYGLELVGVKNTDMSLERARKKILSFIMDPRVLQQSYDLAADDFIRSLIKKAEASEKFFQDQSGAEQAATLNTSQVSEFLELSSDYFLDVAGVLEVLTEDKKTSSLVKASFQADRAADEARYVYNKAAYAYENFKKKLQENSTGLNNQQERLRKLKAQKESAAAAFREAIQERERIRQELTGLIENRTGKVQLDSHDILYIAQWVQRRLQEGDNRPALQVAAGLLRVLSQDLDKAAVDYPDI